MNKQAGITIDDWKLPIFQRHLSAAGYAHEAPVRCTEHTLILKVRYEWAHELLPVVEAAERECAEVRKKREEG